MYKLFIREFLQYGSFRQNSQKVFINLFSVNLFIGTSFYTFRVK